MTFFSFYIISQKDSHFLAKLGAFLGHFQFEIILDMLFPTYHDPWPAFRSILAWSVLRNCSNTQGAKPEGFYFLHNLIEKEVLLAEAGSFFGHFLCEDHLGHAVPDLPRPLANLGRHPGQRIEEKPAVWNNFLWNTYRIWVLWQSLDNFNMSNYTRYSSKYKASSG